MPKIKFRDIRLSKANKQMLAQINSIIQQYQAAGYRLTLRQLYYQLVSRNVILNKQAEYGKLSKLLKEGRMSGVVDWAAIVDRIRSADKPNEWDTPAAAMETIIRVYRKKRMEGQKNYLEVWVEKDALSEVLEVVTRKYHVPILVNRGYSSASAIYESYWRFREALEQGQTVTILYFGDFDPSGIDMIRDVQVRPLEMLLPKASEFLREEFDKYIKEQHKGDEREAYESLLDEYEHDEDCYYREEPEEGEKEARLYFETHRALLKERFKVIPIALTREQIREHQPPPNPAKTTDTRYSAFALEHGTQSWELDALRPEVLNALVEEAIIVRIDVNMYEKILKEEKKEIKKLETIKKNLK